MMTDCGVNETEHHEVVLPAGEMGGEGGKGPVSPITTHASGVQLPTCRQGGQRERGPSAPASHLALESQTPSGDGMSWLEGNFVTFRQNFGRKL